MCIRINSFCGISLRKAAVITGIFTLIETLGFIVAGGIFTYNGLRTNDKGGTQGWVMNPQRFSFVQAFGALYLAFGGLWIAVLLSYAAAVWVKRPLYLLPWLVLQAVTIVAAGANIVTEAAIRNYEGCGFIPVVFLYIFLYVIVFSYYLDLQEEKNNDRNRF